MADQDTLRNNSVDRKDKSLPGFESESENKPDSTSWPLRPKLDEKEVSGTSERESGREAIPPVQPDQKSEI